jgi:phage protein D
MLSVSHKITIGANVYTPADQVRLVELQANASLYVPVNICRVVLAPVEGLQLATDDPVSVELGYDDERTLVFTGAVSTVDWGIERLVVHAAGSFQHLLTARFNLFFEKPKAGDIVSSISSQLGLSSGNVEDGLEFSAYAVGENHTTYDHLRNLARQCGFDFYADAEDKLIFAEYSPAFTHEFQYGANILSFALDEPTASLTGVEVYGESPASHGQGADGYSWLTKKEVKGSAGDTGGVVERVFDPTVRTQENAGQIAEAILADKTQKKRGVLKVIGAPAVKLGDAAKVSGMPAGLQNGAFKVIGIKHIIHARKGFLTAIQVEEM